MDWEAEISTGLTKSPPDDDLEGPSAVIVPILQIPSAPALVLTKRTQSVKTHKGQICFPGGRPEIQDKDLRATAIRECEEEIGVRPQDLEILGRLETVSTLGNTSIVPWVATLPFPYDFLCEANEVEKVINLPIQRLIDEGLTEKDIDVGGGRTFKSPTITVENELVWGATARILQHFLDLL